MSVFSPTPLIFANRWQGSLCRKICSILLIKRCNPTIKVVNKIIELAERFSRHHRQFVLKSARILGIAYHRLKAALDRLQSTTVATSLRQPHERRMHRFSWINEWTEHADAHGDAAGTKLGRLGLAEQAGPAQWTLKPGLEPALRDLGIRGDIIKTMHRAMSGANREPDVAGFALHVGRADEPVLGRLVERGLHDELKGTACAIIESVDGRTTISSSPTWR
jgi:hypothetical protein